MSSGDGKTYFISDLHLGAGYIKDRREHEKRVVSFLQSIEDDASALYLLGDILDYWFEYRTVVPRGYVRFFGQLARMADAGIKIVWFIGNHDIWLYDYLRDEIGLSVVDAKHGGIEVCIDDAKFLLGHGDTFGRQPAGYRMLRSLFHSKFCQVLYGSVHPRWTIPFAHAWSSHSRKGGGVVGVSDSAINAVVAHARTVAEADKDLRYIIMGHYHVALDAQVSDRCRLIILGNWIDRSTYAVFDGNTLELKEFV